jgi:hypothetical protein
MSFADFMHRVYGIEGTNMFALLDFETKVIQVGWL